MPMPNQQCPECHQPTLGKNGKSKGRQKWRCRNPDCSYTRIDGAGIHGSEPKVKPEALTQVEKNQRSRPPTGTARTGSYWYVICTNNTKEGFIALVRGNRKALRKANPGKYVRLLSGYPVGMRRWLWERRTENNSEEN